MQVAFLAIEDFYFVGKTCLTAYQNIDPKHMELKAFLVPTWWGGNMT